MWSLDAFNLEAGYAVFDDIADFKPLYYKSWFGAQQEFYATDKYRKKKLIKWGNPCILLCNELPDFGTDFDWWDKNCKIIKLLNKLY